jgi:hypothetical protein
MIKQFDKVLHPKYGAGYVLHIQFRHKENLYMIAYSDGSHDWMLKEEVVKYKNSAGEIDE